MPLSNQIGLLALLSLIPFIIIYLRKPKAKDKVIPSLMFLLKNKKVSKKYSLFRQFFQNILFFLQLLALVLLAVSIASPFVNINYNKAMENTIIVLDASASTQTKDGLTTRFGKEISEAKKRLSGKISIILAENNPLVALEEGNKKEALDILSKLGPKSTSTNIGDAMLLARDLLKDKKGKLIVLSDFLNNEGSDVIVAKRAITSEGLVVEFVDIANKANNIGIIDLVVTKEKTTAYLKNFNDKEQIVPVELIKDDKIIDNKNIKIASNSIESIRFETPTGISKIVLNINDDFAIDNVGYISAPLAKKIKVLLITNLKSSYLMSALKSSKDIDLTIAEPPVIPKFDFDVIIMDKFLKNLLLPDIFDELNKFVGKGNSLIVTLQSDLNEVDMLDLLPVKLANKIQKKTKVCINVINQFTKQFENNLCFTAIPSYLKATKKNESILVASTEDNTPIIAFKDKGSGKIVYYGIFDDNSDFKTLTEYPIFWNELIKFLVPSENIEGYNYKSGNILAVDNQEIKTPSGTITASKLLLDEVGIYNLNDKNIAVNLLNEKESDISKDKSNINQKLKDFNLKEESTKIDFNFEIPLILMVFIILSLEIFYIKKRGDL